MADSPIDLGERKDVMYFLTLIPQSILKTKNLRKEKKFLFPGQSLLCIEMGACFKKLILGHTSVASILLFCASGFENRLTVSGYVGNYLSYRDL